MPPPCIDTHCHLTHPELSGEENEVLERARAAGLEACVTIGTGVDDARRATELASRHPGFVAATAGIDPFSSHAAGDGFEACLRDLEGLLRSGRFVGVGEIGLDYHYDLDPRPVQAARFERQVELAIELDLPVVVHVREAHEDLAAVLARHPRARGVIHSFTAGPREAASYLSLGWYLAFNGVVTFRNAEPVREAARLVPPERLLVETDSPYLAPVPRRGERCEPAFVPIVVARLAETRDEDPAAVAAVTTRNARTLFGI